MERGDRTAHHIFFDRMVLRNQEPAFQSWLDAIGNESLISQSKIIAYTAAYTSVVALVVKDVAALEWRRSFLDGSFRSVLQFLNGQTPEEEESPYDEDALDDLDEIGREVAEHWLTTHPSHPLAEVVAKYGLSAPLIFHATFTLAIYEGQKPYLSLPTSLSNCSPRSL